jgi:DMSO/TMAO reductase YedYZ molybdopterin-dependent catalytic subunit
VGIQGAAIQRLAFTSALLMAVSAPMAIAAPVVLTVDGKVPHPLALTAADLAALPRVTVQSDLHGHMIVCSGPWLIDVLAKAGLPIGADVHGPALAVMVVATATDGYRATFTLGELDRTLGNAPVLVADTCDGKSLDAADGPVRLVAVGDQRGARSVRQLVRLAIVELPPP